MTNQQLYLAIGLSVIVVLTSVTVSLFQLLDIKNDIRAIHQELIGIRKDMAALTTALTNEVAALRLELTRDYVRKQ